MSDVRRTGLLQDGDPAAVKIVNPGGRSRFLLIGDHAGVAIPKALGTLGLGEADLTRHIAVDIGVMALGEALATMLDARFIAQRYSRLVIDCNRALDAPGSIVETSDGSPVPGNAALSSFDRAARAMAIHTAYQNTIAQALAAQALAERGHAEQATVLIALHSFTPMMCAGPSAGALRPWQIGVLHDRGDTTFAHALLARLSAMDGWCIGDNEPYRMDTTDYTVPRHAYGAGLSRASESLPYAEIEVRQDLLGDANRVERMAVVLARALRDALG